MQFRLECDIVRRICAKEPNEMNERTDKKTVEFVVWNWLVNRVVFVMGAEIIGVLTVFGAEKGDLKCTAHVNCCLFFINVFLFKNFKTKCYTAFEMYSILLVTMDISCILINFYQFGHANVIRSQATFLDLFFVWLEQFVYKWCGLLRKTVF